MKHFIYGLCLVLFSTAAVAETLPQGITAMKQAVLKGDVGAFYRRVAVGSIVAAEVNRAVFPHSTNLAAKAARQTVKTAANAYLAWEIRRMFRTGAGTRRAAVNNFRVHKLTQKGRQATASASYSVPGAAETVGLFLTQNKQAEWVIVGVSSRNLRRAVDRLARR
ncbi:MAG: hypothetical protein WC529_00655 [Candidatus Margulisiibacteriota bacterium]